MDETIRPISTMTTTFSDARLELANYLRYAGIQVLVKEEFIIEARPKGARRYAGLQAETKR
jgi:hypothetical protein